MLELSVQDVAVDRNHRPVIEQITMGASVESMLLLGAPVELGLAIAGVKMPSRGTIRWGEEHASVRLARGEIAYVAVDAAMPPKWTVRHYLQEIAALSSPDGVGERVNRAIARLELTASAEKPLGLAPLLVRRATSIAGIVASGATIAVLEDNTALRGMVRGAPLEKEEWISTEGSLWLAQLVGKALERLTWIVVSSNPDSPFRSIARELVVLSGARVAFQGDAVGPLAASLFVVRVLENSTAFSDGIRARGGSIAAADGGRFFVQVGKEWTAGQIVRFARELGSLVLDVEPIITSVGR